MGKQSTERKLRENEASAMLRTLRTSAQKLNLVAQEIRGISAEKALAKLAFSRRRIASDVRKVLQSAIANAENNHLLTPDQLRIIGIYADKGPVLKRIRPSARGRSGRVNKRSSHITVVVDEEES